MNKLTYFTLRNICIIIYKKNKNVKFFKKIFIKYKFYEK